ncbi:hypothetical protein EHYA_06831 [Embleya hyalina]|uniref:Uncharacterized protein n=1 Tax=Embleya hyalina TaxID=516124 RepID=A0A401YX01_9ACTN|nr:hypothetical protein EHYA_06831 [Embleya hyalina]
MEACRRILAGTLAGVATTVALAFVAPPAQAESQSTAATTRVQQTDGRVGTLGFGECADVLSAAGYTVYYARAAACSVGTGVGTVSAIAACGVSLTSTFVMPFVAGAACAAAALP